MRPQLGGTAFQLACALAVLIGVIARLIRDLIA